MSNVVSPVEIAVGVGATFTDLVLRDADGVAQFFTSLMTEGEVSKGIVNGLTLIAQQVGRSLRDLLSNCRSFACGTTAAPNAILASKTARVVPLCTEGFRDILTIREDGRPKGCSIAEQYPQPYIPRELTFGARERINAEGGGEIPLASEQVRAALKLAALHEPPPWSRRKEAF